LSLVGGCGGTTEPAKSAEPTTATFGVESYLPLIDDSVLSFETEVEGSQEKGLLVMQIQRPRPNVAELKIGGKIHRLDLLKEGVRVIEGGWLLKLPLEVGATFAGQYGTVKVTHVNRTVKVPAGTFEGCVETEETTGTSRTLTRYCPTLGITELEIESLSADAPGREVARLKSHGALVDLGQDQLKVSPSD
jgi:hypothetical protein